MCLPVQDAKQCSVDLKLPPEDFSNQSFRVLVPNSIKAIGTLALRDFQQMMGFLVRLLRRSLYNQKEHVTEA